MDEIIASLRGEPDPSVLPLGAVRVQDAARRLEEVRMFLERFAAGEQPPEGCTYEEWAKELLA